MNTFIFSHKSHKFINIHVISELNNILGVILLMEQKKKYLNNNNGDMGIGTLIIFMSVLLIAAITAGMMIYSGGALQKKAIKTNNIAIKSTDESERLSAWISDQNDKANQGTSDQVLFINDPLAVPYSGGTYTFYLKNLGTSDITINEISVFLDGNVVPKSQISVSFMGNDAAWNAGKILQLDVALNIQKGSHDIRVTTDTGIDATFEFKT